MNTSSLLVFPLFNRYFRK